MEHGRLILVGEDNFAVRDVVMITFERAGYRVMAFAHAASVLASAAELQGQVSAAVLDIGLPGRSSIEYLALLRTQSPQLRCLLMSGSTRPVRPPEMEPGTAFLQKPISMNDLVEALDPLQRAESAPTPAAAH